MKTPQFSEGNLARETSPAAESHSKKKRLKIVAPEPDQAKPIEDDEEVIDVTDDVEEISPEEFRALTKKDPSDLKAVREQARAAAERRIGEDEKLYDQELARGEQGEITGLRNTFEVTPGAVLRAAGPAVREIQKKHAWAQKHLQGSYRDEVLHDLEIEAKMWTSMSEQAIAAQNRGNLGPTERAEILNQFYQRPESSEELSHEVVAEIEMSPPERLRDRFEDVSKERQRLVDLLEEKKGVYELVLANVEDWEKRKKALEELMRARESLNGVRKERLSAMEEELVKLRLRIRKGLTDTRGDGLKHGIDEAKAEVEQARGRLKMIKDKEMKGQIASEVKAAEETLMRREGELMIWMKDVSRDVYMEQEAERMVKRAEELNADIIQYQLDIQIEEDLYDEERELLQKRVDEIDGAALEKAFNSAQNGYREVRDAFVESDAEFNKLAEVTVHRAVQKWSQTAKPRVSFETPAEAA